VYGDVKGGVREACGELRLPLDVFAWESGMQRAGLQNGALYLVRPDGYVALADPAADQQRLRQYFTARAWRRGAP
jgi:hypothetical protein